jgi:hypothetical protein
MYAERWRGALRDLSVRLLLTCVIATALACGSESEPGMQASSETPEAGVPDDAIVPRPPLAPPAPSADGMLWLLALEVDQATEVEVLIGTPLLFSVSLTGAGTGSPGRLGGADKPWHAYVELELAESGEPAPWPVLALASRSLDFEGDAAGSGAVHEGSKEAVVAAGRVHLLTLAIPPDVAVRMPAGRHSLRAVVLRPDLSGEAARIVSEPVAVVVRATGTDPAEQAALERRRAMAEGDFFVRAGRFEEAQRVAAQLVARDRADAAAQMLLGDAAVGLRRDEEARSAYLAALQLVAGKAELNEVPQALFDRLSEVEQRLVPPEQDPEAAPEAQ